MMNPTSSIDGIELIPKYYGNRPIDVKAVSREC